MGRRRKALNIIWFDRLSSTNSEAKTLADKGTEEWTVVVSDTQTEGRGRFGRVWKSPKGGLWFSLVVKPVISSDKIGLLQLLFANALRNGIQRATGVQSQIKWPNDLVIGKKKLAGILIETKVRSSRMDYAVVGVGVNVNLSSSKLPAGATSLAIVTGKKFNLQEVLDSLLKSFSEHFEDVENREAIIEDWWNHCAHREMVVAIKMNHGTIKGHCVGVNVDGSLSVKTARGVTLVPDGTLRLAS